MQQQSEVTPSIEDDREERSESPFAYRPELNPAAELTLPESLPHLPGSKGNIRVHIIRTNCTGIAVIDDVALGDNQPLTSPHGSIFTAPPRRSMEPPPPQKKEKKRELETVTEQRATMAEAAVLPAHVATPAGYSSARECPIDKRCFQ